MTKVLKVRMRTYAKQTRALIRHLRLNGGQVDVRTGLLQERRRHSLRQLMRLSEDPQTPDDVKVSLAAFALGMIGLNDQIEAMLTLRPA